MDLNNLDLPEPAKAQLRQKLEKLHRDYETDLENLTDDATDAMESAKPLERQDIVLRYTRDASERSRRYYTDTRNLWQKYAGIKMPPYVSSTCDEYEVLYRQVGGFTGTDWNGHNYTNLKHGNANGLTVEDLWPDLKTVDVCTIDHAEQPRRRRDASWMGTRPTRLQSLCILRDARQPRIRIHQ